jgi:hypothetical protein
MNDWRKRMDSEWQQLETESKGGGTPMEVRVVSMRGFDKLIERGEQGDAEARALVLTIDAWFEYANAARADNVWPKCISCENEVHAGEVCGWVLLTPVERDKQMGIAGVICPACYRLGPQKITENAMRKIAQDGAASVTRLQ